MTVGKSELLMGMVALVSVIVPATCKADLVTFDLVPSSGNPIRSGNLTTEGYTFASSHFHIIDSPGICEFGGCVTDGTQYLGLDGPTLAQPVTMMLAGGGTFSLNALDGDKLFNDDASAAAGGFENATEIDVVGNLFGGGTVSAMLLLNGGTAFQHFTLPGTFVNLTSVVFQGNADHSIAIDNITTNAVPEPSSILLLGTVTLLVAQSVRRRLRKVN